MVQNLFLRPEVQEFVTTGDFFRHRFNSFLKTQFEYFGLLAAPPSSVEIMDHPTNSKIEIKENQEFTLECRVRNAKPAAKIVWYRGNVELNIRKYLAYGCFKVQSGSTACHNQQSKDNENDLE